MQSKTLDYYNKHSSTLYERYNCADVKHIHKLLDRYVNGSNKVLDIGFGSGRDILHLKRRGVKCWGIDGSLAFVERFKSEYPSIKEKIFHSVLPSIEMSSDLSKSLKNTSQY